ncbi:MAG: hypothetical protein IJ343_11725 [Clostridia bacterium]|nr:hypothetical protein [Clostridia bacterium]
MKHNILPLLLALLLFRQQVPETRLDIVAPPYYHQMRNTCTVICTTLPGADVEILTPHSDLDVTTLDSTGVFTFAATFDKIGENTISIQASSPGRKTARVDCTVYYLPYQETYCRKAWLLSNSSDYADLVSNISVRAERQQVYVALGKIDSFVSHSPQMAVMYCSEDGQSHPVVLQNATNTVWQEGVYYRIYADVCGICNGMPLLIARYCYQV